MRYAQFKFRAKKRAWYQICTPSWGIRISTGGEMLDGCSPAALTLDATNKCGFKIFFCAPLPCFSSIIRCPSVRFPVAYFHQKAFHQNNFSNVEPSILRRWLIIQAKNLFRPTLQETKRSRRLIAETQKANTALTSSFRHLYLKPNPIKVNHIWPSQLCWHDWLSGTVELTLLT